MVNTWPLSGSESLTFCRIRARRKNTWYCVTIRNVLEFKCLWHLSTSHIKCLARKTLWPSLARCRLPVCHNTIVTLLPTESHYSMIWLPNINIHFKSKRKYIKNRIWNTSKIFSSRDNGIYDKKWQNLLATSGTFRCCNSYPEFPIMYILHHLSMCRLVWLHSWIKHVHHTMYIVSFGHSVSTTHDDINECPNN